MLSVNSPFLRSNLPFNFPLHPSLSIKLHFTLGEAIAMPVSCRILLFSQVHVYAASETLLTGSDFHDLILSRLRRRVKIENVSFLNSHSSLPSFFLQRVAFFLAASQTGADYYNGGNFPHLCRSDLESFWHRTSEPRHLTFSC